MNFRRFISELKRRNVPRAALAYLVVAWMIIQVSSILLPTFEAPPYVMQIIVVGLFVGFPLWVLFSWIYDISSKGIIKTSDAHAAGPSETDAAVSGRLNKVIIFALSIAVILLIYNQFIHQSIVKSDGLLASSGIDGTIAVLPLTNTKPDPDTNYLGFAIANQIIGDLNYLQNITVRSSSEIRKFDKEEFDLAEVSESLNVNYALVGNYLKEDNHIRVNVELIELASYSMVWRSEDIEVDFSNTFVLQDRVAKEVVDGLNIKFSEREMQLIVKDIPKDPLAYEYYLRSTSYPLNTEGDKLAVEMLKKSIELDSTYAPAFADLGFRTQRLTLFEMLDKDVLKVTEAYYLKALRLNPDLLAALGYLTVFYTETARTEEAIELTRKMIDINPNNASALFSQGYLYRYIGMIEESVNKMEKAIEIDPKNPNYSRIGVSYLCQNRYKEALKAFKKGKGTSYSLTWQGMTLFRMGRFKEALSYFDQVIEKESEPYMLHSCIAFKSIILGQTQEGLRAIKILENANTSDSEGWYYWAVVYTCLNHREEALRCLREAVNRGYYNYTFMMSDPLLEKIRKDPQFVEISEIARKQHLYFKEKYFGEANINR
jgi:TolB-like protein/lipoprotein NlpI